MGIDYNNCYILKDFDENLFSDDGVYVLPVADIIYSQDFSSDCIKKLIIPEGVKYVVGSFYLKSLEALELPSTLLEIVGSRTFEFSSLSYDKVTIKSQDLEYCDRFLGYTCTMEYAKDRFKSLISDIDSLDISGMSFNDILNITRRYDHIISDLDNDSQQELSNKFMEFLSKKKDGVIIGDRLVKFYINNDEVLSQSALLYHCMREFDRLGINRRPVLFQRVNQKKLSYDVDDTISIGYESFVSSLDKKVDDVNMYMLYAISHEVQHARQNDNGNKDSDDISSQLDYIDSIIQSTCDSFSRGYGYHSFHDLSPDEIMADVKGCDSVIEFLDTHPDISNVDSHKRFLENLRSNRIKKAHGIDEFGNVTIEDFREHAYNYLLSLDNLSESETIKVREIADLYQKIKMISSMRNINLYEETLGNDSVDGEINSKKS